MNMRQLVYIVCVIGALLGMVACDKEDPQPDKSATRTVLIYFAGDNSLSGYVSSNLAAIKQGILEKGLNGGNLLVYIDQRSDTPALYQLTVEADTVRQIEVERYEADQNSATTETLTRVLDKVVADFPAEGYGLTLWSHGTGWLPADYKSYLRSFGQDGDRYIELNDLAEALAGYHFDFLLFDACYMSCTEVAYALRECADYLVGSPNEVLASGFPYQDIMGMMFDERADVEGIAAAFHAYYAQGRYPYATVSVVKCDEMEALASACQAICKDKSEEELFAVSVDELQLMERLRSDTHALYDFEDYVSRLATEEEYAAFKQALDRAVVYKNATPEVFFANPSPSGSIVPMERFSGLSIYVPQAALPELNAWYKGLAWYKATCQ